MTTRLKRPSVWRHVGVMIALVAFQGYLGYSAIGGQYGIESQKQMLVEIEELRARSAALQVEMEAYRHRVSLFSASRLDPDILTERARALLSMAHMDDMVVMLDQETGLPISSLSVPSTERQLIDIIEDGVD
jgi:cell division protein FtsB